MHSWALWYPTSVPQGQTSQGEGVQENSLSCTCWGRRLDTEKETQETLSSPLRDMRKLQEFWEMQPLPTWCSFTLKQFQNIFFSVLCKRITSQPLWSSELKAFFLWFSGCVTPGKFRSLSKPLWILIYQIIIILYDFCEGKWVLSYGHSMGSSIKTEAPINIIVDIGSQELQGFQGLQEINEALEIGMWNSKRMRALLGSRSDWVRK